MTQSTAVTVRREAEAEALDSGDTAKRWRRSFGTREDGLR